MKDLEISKVLNLAKGNKYAIACAAFDLVDHIFKVEVPRALKTRKLSVQAMTLLQDGAVKFGYETKTTGEAPSYRSAKKPAIQPPLSGNEAVADEEE